VDRVLDVVPGVSSEGRDDADPLRKRRRLLFLLVVEPATLFEFASQSLDGSRLVAVADDDHFPRFEVDLPTFDPVVDIALKDDLGPVFEVGIHLPVAVRPDHTGKLGIAVSEGEIERRAVLMEIGYFADTTDTLEGRCLLNEGCNLLIQLRDAEYLSVVLSPSSWSSVSVESAIHIFYILDRSLKKISSLFGVQHLPTGFTFTSL